MHEFTQAGVGQNNAANLAAANYGLAAQGQQFGQNQALADEFTENVNYPDHQWDRVASAERIQSWIERNPARSCRPLQPGWHTRPASDQRNPLSG